MERRSTIVNLSPKEGTLSAANVLGNGFTIYKTWELSVDLKVKRNDDSKWANVFIFTVTVENRTEVKSLRTKLMVTSDRLFRDHFDLFTT